MYTWDSLNAIEAAALSGNGGEKGVFIRPSFVRALNGDGNAAIILTQFIYWSRSDAAKENDGWFYRTGENLRADTGLSKDSQKRVRETLERSGLIEQEKRGKDNRVHFRVNLRAVLALFEGQPVKRLEGQPANGLEGSPANGLEGQPRNIVNKEENTGEDGNSSNTSYSQRASTPRRNAKKTKVHVFDEPKLKAFPAWAMASYPKRPDGVGATEEFAEKMIVRLGQYTEGDEAGMARAQKAVDEFIAGIKNIKAAVDDGSYKREFVPWFVNFCGLKYYGQTPKYKEWASRTPLPPKKRGLVV